MKRFFSHIWITAIHEFKDSIRSRWAVSLMLIYLAICMFMSYQFTGFLADAEVELIKTMGVSEGAKTGAVTSRLWDIGIAKNTMMRTYKGDEKLVEHLMQAHPVVLVFAWFTVILGAMLTLLMSSPRVADELGTRSARFVLYRSDQLSWCLGKYWGQAIVLLPVFLISAFGVWCISAFRLEGFERLKMLSYLLEYGFMSYLYVLAWLGLATCVSQLTKSQFLAVAFAIGGAFKFAIIEGFHEHLLERGTDHTNWRQLVDVLYQFTPMSYRGHLWGPEPFRQIIAGIMLVVLGHLYLALGYFATYRRDI